jgi:hypothetical protein
MEELYLIRIFREKDACHANTHADIVIALKNKFSCQISIIFFLHSIKKWEVKFRIKN